jgi:hypothetical protein
MKRSASKQNLWPSVAAGPQSKTRMAKHESRLAQSVKDFARQHQVLAPQAALLGGRPEALCWETGSLVAGQLLGKLERSLVDALKERNETKPDAVWLDDAPYSAVHKVIQERLDLPTDKVLDVFDCLYEESTDPAAPIEIDEQSVADAKVWLRAVMPEDLAEVATRMLEKAASMFSVKRGVSSRR